MTIGCHERSNRSYAPELTTQVSNFFTNRVVNYWNSLPGGALAVGSVDSFKKHVDKFLNGEGIW